MFRKFAEALRRMARPESVAPPQYDDPLAARIDWGPLCGGGTNICTHRLHQTGAGCYEFKPTLGARLFGLLFIIIGLPIMVLPTTIDMARGPIDPKVLITIPFGGLFVIVGFFVYRFMTRRVVCDGAAGWFWRKRDPQLLSPATVEADRKNYALLDDVHALQIVAERCTGSKGHSYMSYELNLIRHDGSRMNLVDHGSLDKLRQDAEILADALGVPIWSAAGC